MEDRIRIRELSDWEIEELNKMKGFRRIKPVECADCGTKGTFQRRLFHIAGLKDDDSDRGILAFHMKREHGIEGYIFRTDGCRKFIEAARCPKCKSTNVIFDLVIGKDG